MKVVRAMVAVSLSVLALIALPGTAFACSGRDVVNCENTNEYATLGLLGPAELQGLPRVPGDIGSTVVDISDKRPQYEYRTLADCDEAVPDSGSQEVLCSRALKACPPDTVGPLARVWRRAVLDGVVVEPWNSVGLTCHTDVAPG